MDEENEEEVLTYNIEGYLFKQGGGNRKKWQKRYFELLEGNILYYKSEEKKKLKGTIYLTEGWGVRNKKQCTCTWPPGIRPTRCFGLATKNRTYYFYSTEQSVEEWMDYLQAVINVMGEPNDDHSKDHDGKPAGKNTKMAKAAAKFGAKAAVTIGAKAAKVAVQYADVDDTVKDLVSGGADIVTDAVKELSSAGDGKDSSKKEARSVPNASEEDTQDLARGFAKGVGSTALKKSIQPLGRKDMKSEKALGDRIGSVENMMKMGSDGSKNFAKLSTAKQKIQKDSSLGIGKVKVEGSDVAKGLTKGLGSAIKKQPLQPPGAGGSPLKDNPRSFIKPKENVPEDMKDFKKVAGGVKGLGKMAGSLGKTATSKGIGDLKKKKSPMDKVPSDVKNNPLAKKAGIAAVKGSGKLIGKGISKGAAKKWGKTGSNNEEEEYQEEGMESYGYDDEADTEEEVEENEYDVLY